MAAAARSDIEVYIRAFGSDAVVRQMARVGRAIAGASSAATQTTTALVRRLAGGITEVVGTTANAVRKVASLPLDAFTKLSGVFTGLVAKAGLFAGALTGLGFTAFKVGGAIKSVTDDAAELTSVVLALRAVNDEIGKASSLPRFEADGLNGLRDAAGAGASKTASDLAYLNKTASDLGLPLKSLGKDYISLSASTSKANISLSESRAVFTGVGQAAVVMGLSADQSHRAFVALQQIASKGQVYAEELKGQLAEALPGIVPLAAQAFGKSVKLFNEQVAAGQVSATEFFQKVGKKLNSTYGEAAKLAADTTRVALARLSNAYFNAKVIIGNGALDATLRSIVKSATNVIEQLTGNGALKRFGEQLAAGIQPIADYFKRGERDLSPFVRALDFAAFAVRKLVDAVGVVGNVLGKTYRIILGTRDQLVALGVTLPSIGDTIKSVFGTILSTVEALNAQRFGDNPIANLFASIIALAEQAGLLVVSFFSGSANSAIRTGAGVFQLLAETISQAGFALMALRTGQASEGLNEQGVGILRIFVRIRDAVQSVAAAVGVAFDFVVASLKGIVAFGSFVLDAVFGEAPGKAERAGEKIKGALDITDTKKAWQDFLVLISGGQAYEAADGQLSKLFAIRTALGELLKGNEMPTFVDAGGNEIELNRLNILFKVRDVVLKIVQLLAHTVEIAKGFVDGVADGLANVLYYLAPVVKLLGFIANLAGFDSILKAVGYAAGLLFVMNRIASVIAVIGTLIRGPLVLGAFNAIVGAATGLGALLGVGALAGGGIIAAVVLLGVALYQVYKNWERITREAQDVKDIINGVSSKDLYDRHYREEASDIVAEETGFDSRKSRRIVDEQIARTGVGNGSKDDATVKALEKFIAENKRADKSQDKLSIVIPAGQNPDAKTTIGQVGDAATIAQQVDDILSGKDRESILNDNTSAVENLTSYLRDYASGATPLQQQNAQQASMMAAAAQAAASRATNAAPAAEAYRIDDGPVPMTEFERQRGRGLSPDTSAFEVLDRVSRINGANLQAAASNVEGLSRRLDSVEATNDNRLTQPIVLKMANGREVTSYADPRDTPTFASAAAQQVGTRAQGNAEWQ